MGSDAARLKLWGSAMTSDHLEISRVSDRVRRNPCMSPLSVLVMTQFSSLNYDHSLVWNSMLSHPAPRDEKAHPSLTVVKVPGWLSKWVLGNELDLVNPFKLSLKSNRELASSRKEGYGQRVQDDNLRVIIPDLSLNIFPFQGHQLHHM